MNIRNELSGPNAFYNKSDYVETTRNANCQSQTVNPCYTFDTESKVIRIAKQILSILLFPIGLYNLAHIVAARIAILPASTPKLMGYTADHALHSRSAIQLLEKAPNDWKYKRISISVNGTLVDAMIVGKPNTLDNGRWTLFSNGNGEFYEDKPIHSREFKQIITELNSNAILFNYPGVGASTGIPTRKALANAYRAMLNFLEDKEKGIGAKEIIGYGHSIGGGVQADGLASHKLQKDVKYVFVKSRTFYNLSSVASSLIHPIFGLLVKALGWNQSPGACAKDLKAPEIIIQSAKVKSPQYLTSSYNIVDDGIIKADSSLAKGLLNDPGAPKLGKFYIGVPEDHNEDLEDTGLLTEKVKSLLSKK